MKTNALLMAAFGLIMSALTAQAVPIYSVKDIGTLPGFTQMTGLAINIEGDVVGTAYVAPDESGGHGFLYHRGKLTDLGPGEAIAINALGQVIGYSFDSSGNSIPFLYQRGQFTALPADAIAINNQGDVLLQVVGAVEVRKPNGTIVSHAVTQGDLFVGWAINDLGQVVGRDFTPGPSGNEDEGFYNNLLLVQPGGSYRVIANAGVNNYCFPSDLNILGRTVGLNLVGYYNTFYQLPLYRAEAMLFNPDGKSVALGNLLSEVVQGAPPNSSAEGINSFGVIVGTCQTVDGGISRAFVFVNRAMRDLNALVDHTGKGLTITEARKINDLGQIVGTATDAYGIRHAVILAVVGFR